MTWGVPRIGAVTETTVSGGNITPAEPASSVAGDLQICFIAYRSTPAFSPPAGEGWSLVATQQSSGDTDATQGIASGVMYWRIRPAAAGTRIFTRTLGDVAQACIVGYPVDAGQFPNYVTGSANTLGVGSATVTTATISTTGTSQLIVAGCSVGDAFNVSAFTAATDPTTGSGATDTTNAPTAGTWRERVDTSTSTGADSGIAIGDAVRATAGATGTIQVTSATTARSVLIAAAFKMVPQIVAGLGALSVAGLVPTVTASQKVLVTTGLGSSTVTGFAEALPRKALVALGLAVTAGFAPSLPRSEIVGLGAATTSGLAPTVSVTARVTVNPGTGVVSVTGNAPSLPVTRRTGVGAISLTGLAPTEHATANVRIATGVGAATATAFAPALPRRESLGIGSGILAGLTPSVRTPVTTHHDVGIVTVTGFAPALPITVHVEAASAILTGIAPTAHGAANVRVTPGVGVTAATGFALALPRRETIGVGVNTVTGFAPLAIATSGGMGLGELTVQGFTPSILLPVIVGTDTGTATLAGFGVALPVTVHIPARDALLTGFEPIVALPIKSQPDVGVANVDGLTPTVVVSTIVRPAIGIVNVTGIAPIAAVVFFASPAEETDLVLLASVQTVAISASVPSVTVAESVSTHTIATSTPIVTIATSVTRVTLREP